MLNFGRHFKKDKTECLIFENFTKARDHLNPLLMTQDITKEESLIQSLNFLNYTARDEHGNLGGGRQEEKKEKGRGKNG